MAPQTQTTAQDLPRREERPLPEDIGLFICTRFPDFPTLFPYQADANTFAGDDKAGQDLPLLQSLDRDKNAKMRSCLFEPEDTMIPVRRGRGQVPRRRR